MSNDIIPEDILLKIREAKEQQLEILDLSYSGLTKIPEEVFELKQIKILNLRGNKIYQISESIRNLSKLTELNLRKNQLTYLPESISNLSNLTKINLSSNQLTYLPESIGNLSNLTEIVLSSNRLKYLPKCIDKLSDLTKINLWGNHLKNLPTSISNCSNLTEINLGKNLIEKLPDSIGALHGLTTFYLDRNLLKNLPKSIGNLNNLIKLYLEDNKLEKIPESLGNLTSLTELYLDKNLLTEIPESLGNLSNLTRLNLYGNQLSYLPESIGNFSSLISLNLYANQIVELPESIGDISNLKKLNLHENRLISLPKTISNLRNLTKLNLEGNPLEKPPIEVCNKGIKEIQEYFNQLEEVGEDYIYEAKLLVIGEPGAGKTSLTKKIQNPQFQLQENEKSTEGIEVIHYSFALDNEQRFKINIWDFGGQEIYHATHQFFLTKRSLYTLVVDTRREDTDFYYWLNIVELLSDNSPLLIIKNEKQDRQREINERALRGQFTNLKETLATNLKTNRGLEEILTHVKHYIQNLPHIGQTLPKTWVLVRQALEEDERNYISLQEYFDICQANGFKRLEDKLQLIGYLHDLGVCLHFQDEEDSLLYKTVILKPEWGTSAVYTVLDNKQVVNNQGRFTRTDLKNIWNEEKYASMRGELLELMKKFQLCYAIPNRKDTFIAPQLLSDNQPEYDWNEYNNLILRYSYPNFMPKGILTRFIVIMHQYIDQQEYVWKTGVILNKDNTKAEVIENYGKREIRIRVVGHNNKNFLTIVTHELDKINNSYKRLNYKKLIPCNCSECNNQQEPYFHSFDVLQKAKLKGQREVQCQTSFQMVDVLKLIDDVIISYEQLEPIPKSKKKMKTIKIFLASSSELKADREQFEIFINRKNNEYVEEGIFLKLVLWEDFLDAMSSTRLQDEYNKAVAGCDIFVSLFYTKVGEYTEEEFEKAFKTFKDNNKPLIYTYFKDAAINTSKITSEIISLLNFKQKLDDLGHFYTNYKDINDLNLQFNNQLTKFLPDLTGISPSNIQQHNAQESQNAPKVVQNFYGSVDTATGNVAGNQNPNDINTQSKYIDQSRTQNISGETINASGAGAFSLGDNYGTIANTVNQVSDFDNPNKTQLKQLLIKLQSTINQENLDSETKSEFLDEIKITLDALSNSQNDSTKKQTKKAMRTLRGIAAELSPNSATVKICNQLPDLIAQVF